MLPDEAPSHVGTSQRMPTSGLSDSILQIVSDLFPPKGVKIHPDEVSSHAETPKRTPTSEHPSDLVLDALQRNIQLFVETGYATAGRPVTLSFPVNDTLVQLVKHTSPAGFSLLVAIPDHPNPGCYVVLGYYPDRSKLSLRSSLKKPSTSIPSCARFMHSEVRATLERARIPFGFLELFLPKNPSEQTLYAKSKKGGDVIECLFVPLDSTDPSAHYLRTGFLPPYALEEDKLLAFFAKLFLKNHFFALPPPPSIYRAPPPEELWDDDNPNEHAHQPAGIRLSAV